MEEIPVIANRILVHLYHHLVVEKNTKAARKELYFLDEKAALRFPSQLPPESECLHEEPSLIAALHDIDTGHYYRLSNKAHIEVQ